jgi:hypothetical protein
MHVQQQRPDVVQQQVPLSKQQQEAILPQPSSIPNMPSTDSSSLNVLENWAENYQMPDEMSLWDDGDHYSSRKDLQLAYLPPKSDLPGLAVALSLIGCWVSVAAVMMVFLYFMPSLFVLHHVGPTSNSVV